MKAWTQQEAIELCRSIEAVCPLFGCHVALTGGLLYKEGARTDLDILFYRVRQTPQIDIDGLVKALVGIGIHFHAANGFVVKFTHEGRPIDAFFPEAPAGEYPLAEAEEKESHELEMEIAGNP